MPSPSGCNPAPARPWWPCFRTTRRMPGAWPCGPRCRTRCSTRRSSSWCRRPTPALASRAARARRAGRAARAAADAQAIAPRGCAWRSSARRIEQGGARAYATDLATGLPNQAPAARAHDHLLALREREPAPMALLVLRIEGLATAEARARHGGRQRAAPQDRRCACARAARERRRGLASAHDAFAVLLAWIDDAAATPQRVADKLRARAAAPVRASRARRRAWRSPWASRSTPQHGKRCGGAAAPCRRAWRPPARRRGRAGFANRGRAAARGRGGQRRRLGSALTPRRGYLRMSPRQRYLIST